MAAVRERSPLALGVVALTLSFASYALSPGTDREERAPALEPRLALELAAAPRALPVRPTTALADKPQTDARPPSAAALPARVAPPPSRTVFLPERGPSAAEVPVADPANGSDESELYARWRNEQHDPAWTAEISEYLRETSAAAGLDGDSVVQDADCGSSLCRVGLRFDSYEQAGAFQESAHNPDLRYQSMPQADSDGLDVVVYVPRPAEGG